jgi:hypothetical protein
MTGTIDRVITPGVYLVRDQSNRQHRAASQELWRKGDQVTVLDGVIVGHAGKEKITAIYEV